MSSFIVVKVSFRCTCWNFKRKQSAYLWWLGDEGRDIPSSALQGIRQLAAGDGDTHRCTAIFSAAACPHTDS